MDQIDHCPFCGGSFRTPTSRTDSRYPAGYQCDDCNELLEISVVRFPLA